MPKYQTTDKKTGKTFEFDWYADTPPTDADLEEVISSVPQEEPSTLDTFLQYSGLKGLGQVVRENPAAAGATVAGLAAAPFTMGASIPTAMAIGGLSAATGAAGGQLTSEALEGTVDEGTLGRVGNAAAWEGTIGAVAPGAAPALKGTASWLYKHALRPGVKLVKDQGLVKALTETGLKHGIAQTEGGAAKALNLVVDKTDEVRQMLAPHAHETVNPAEVLREMGPTVDKFRNQVTPAADVNELYGVAREFADNHSTYVKLPGGQVVRQGTPIPVLDAQDLKTGTYQQLADKYGKLSNASAEGQKALASGLRQGIERIAPEVGPVNAEIGNLIKLRKAILPRLPASAGSSVPAEAAAALGGPKALAFNLLRRAPAQSWAAIGLDRAGNIADPNLLAAAVRALQATINDETGKPSKAQTSALFEDWASRNQQ